MDDFPEYDDLPPRITTRQLALDVVAILNLEKGVLYTIKGLLTKPLKTITDYLKGNRRRHANPLRLLVFSSAIAAFVTMSFFRVPDDAVHVSNTDTELVEADLSPEERDAYIEQRKAEVQAAMSKEVGKWLDQYLNLFFLMTVPIMALLCALFFMKKGYNLAEHFVINAFLVSLINVFSIFFAPLSLLTEYSTSALLIISLGYTLFFYMSVYKSRHVWGFIKAGLVNLLALIIVGAIMAVFLLIYIQNHWDEFGFDNAG